MKAKNSPDMTERQRVVEAYRTAFNRGYNEGVTAYRHIDEKTGRWDLTADVPSTSGREVYRVTGLGGADWADLGCTCPGGNHPACKHRAVVAFAYKHGVWAVRNAAHCEGCHPYFCGGGCPDAPKLTRIPVIKPGSEQYRAAERRLADARRRGEDADIVQLLEDQLDALDTAYEASQADPVHARQMALTKLAADADHDARVARINAGGLTEQQEKYQAGVAEANRKFRIKQLEEHDKAMESGPYAAAVRKDPLKDMWE